MRRNPIVPIQVSLHYSRNWCHNLVKCMSKSTWLQCKLGQYPCLVSFYSVVCLVFWHLERIHQMRVCLKSGISVSVLYLVTVKSCGMLTNSQRVFCGMFLILFVICIIRTKVSMFLYTRKYLLRWQAFAGLQVNFFRLKGKFSHLWHYLKNCYPL